MGCSNVSPSLWCSCFISLLQGCSHQYGCSGFNWTTFRGNNHIPANIHEFGGSPSRLVGSHTAQLTELEIDSLKVTLPSLQSMVSYESPS